MEGLSTEELASLHAEFFRVYRDDEEQGRDLLSKFTSVSYVDSCTAFRNIASGQCSMKLNTYEEAVSQLFGTCTTRSI